MAQQKRIVQKKISKREQERIQARKDKANFSTIAMRAFIIVILTAMIIGLAIQIIVYN